MINCSDFRAAFQPGTEDADALAHLRACDRCLDHAAHVDPDVMFRALGTGEMIPPGGIDAFVDDVMRGVQIRSAETVVSRRARLGPLMKARRGQPLLLIDIAVPRDIEPEVNFMENVYLYNIDDLQAIADDYLEQRKEEMARCERIIAEKVEALLGERGAGTRAASSPRPAFGHE